MIRRRTLLAAPLLLAASRQAAAQSGAAWPAGRPIRLVVGFPPGGSGDFLARTLSEPLARELGGATILVDNRPGAGSNIAAEHVARSEPDGYTILLGGNFTHSVNPALYRRLPFDPINDFTPITRISDLPLIIAVRADAGINNLAELAARMRAQPGRWNYATPGIGTPSHLVGAKLAKVTGPCTLPRWRAFPASRAGGRCANPGRHAARGPAANPRRDTESAVAQHALTLTRYS